MKTVYKYPFLLEDRQLIGLPKGAKPLTVQLQGGQLCLWVLVDDKVTDVDPFYFAVCGTGHPIPTLADIQYLATVQTGPLVWHIFYCAS